MNAVLQFSFEWLIYRKLKNAVLQYQKINQESTINTKQSSNEMNGLNEVNEVVDAAVIDLSRTIVVSGGGVVGGSGGVFRRKSSLPFRSASETVSKDHSQDEPPSAITFLYNSFCTFTGCNYFITLQYSKASKVLQITFSFFILILVSSYIANLTTLFIRTSMVFTPVNNIEDANLERARVCVSAGTNDYYTIQKFYPRLILIPLNNTDASGTFRALLDGRCIAAVAPKFEVEARLYSKAANPDCRIVIVGSPIRLYSGAW